MGEIAYPKLKHILAEKWAGITSLEVDFVEDFFTTAPGRKIVARAQGKLEYRKAHNLYSFRRQSRSVTTITEAAGSSQVTASRTS